MKHLGIALIIIAAIVLVASWFGGFSTTNAVTFGAYAVMIAGVVLHIMLNKKVSD
ncbi:MAG: hypothetical protein MJZ69_08995 [Bacteroidaceae bacterium]|nr:hypothetical protein [Candidatus Minthousia equi]MCQ2246901.1 hypothetical protein [Bacteroidaceae bacterium]MDO4955505.1 hypothetical protein [Bacteroidales bacterium]